MNLQFKKGSSKKSAYELRKTRTSKIEPHTLSILVDNEAGVLARIIGLFSGRGYNIESLTVSEIDHTGHLSRITIVSWASERVIRQIRALVEREIPVYEVCDLTKDGPSIERELALHSVFAIGENRQKVLAAAKEFSARLLPNSESDALILEQTGTPKQIDELFDKLRLLGQEEVVRTGVVGMRLDSGKGQATTEPQ